MKLGLYDYQNEVIDEYISKYEGFDGLCLSLPMGFGKTIISLEIARKLFKKVLIVCSKTVITSWLTEIEKIYDEGELSYDILHSDFKKKKEMDRWVMGTEIVITTPEVLKVSYTKEIEAKFAVTVPQSTAFEPPYVQYYRPVAPYGTDVVGVKSLHMTEWDCVIVDECQNYMNAKTRACQAIASLCSTRRILLSGTLFQEVSMERVMGLFLLLNMPSPRNVIICRLYVASRSFRGIDQYCIIRKKAQSMKTKLSENVITHTLNEYEEICYKLLKTITLMIYDEYQKMTDMQEVERARKLGGHLLAMMTYLRQSIIIPQIAISQLVSRLAFYEDDMKLVEEPLKKGIEQYGLKEWLESPESATSTRMNTALDILNKHKDENNVVFSNFVTCLEYLKMKHTGKSYILDGSMTIKKRDKILREFKEKGGTLFMTYSLGAEGLNLQAGQNVIHLDCYWNRGKEDQALTRVYRNGQLNEEVRQYNLVSNTGIEEAIFKKQMTKLEAYAKLKKGCYEVRKEKVSLKDVIKVLQLETNRELAVKIKQMGK